MVCACGDTGEGCSILPPILVCSFVNVFFAHFHGWEYLFNAPPALQVPQSVLNNVLKEKGIFRTERIKLNFSFVWKWHRCWRDRILLQHKTHTHKNWTKVVNILSWPLDLPEFHTSHSLQSLWDSWCPSKVAYLTPEVPVYRLPQKASTERQRATCLKLFQMLIL